MKRLQYVLAYWLTPAVKKLMVANVGVFLILLLAGQFMHPALPMTYQSLWLEVLGLFPATVFSRGTVWQLVTYQFVHLSFLHLLFNVLGILWFGSDVERAFGTHRFWKYYLFTGVGAGLVSWWVGTPTIGASGAVFGLLLAFGLLFPNRTLYLYLIIPIKAKYAVILFGGLELFALTMGASDGINHFAHLGGAAFGLLWFFFFEDHFNVRRQFKRWRKRKDRKRFRVIRGNDVEDIDVGNETIH